MIDYQKFAIEKIDEIYRMDDFDEIYTLLVTKDETFSLYSRDAFRFHFTCLRLALSCLAWVNVCRQNHETDEAVLKLFLRHVMERFKTEKTVEIAKAFSEYLYSGDEENPAGETVSMVTKLLQKLEESRGKGTKQVTKNTVDLFKTLAQIAEGIRESFENEMIALA